MSKFFRPASASLSPAEQAARDERLHFAEATMDTPLNQGLRVDLESVENLQRYVDGEQTIAETVAVMRRRIAKDYPRLLKYLPPE